MKLKDNIYNKYLFVPDLILVSIWVLFVMRYAIAISWPVMVICFLRIMVCFQLRNKSAWSFYTSVVFGSLYFLNLTDPGFIYPIRTMMYYISYFLCGDFEEIVDIYRNHNKFFSEGSFALECFWTIWNVVLPIVAGYIQLRRYPYYFRKRILRFSGLTVIIEVIIFYFYYTLKFSYCYEVYSILMLLPALLPFITPLCRSQRRDGLLKWILINRQVRLYIYFTILFIGALLIGLRQVQTLRLVGLVLGVPLFYTLLCNAIKLKINKYLFTYVALALSGFLYWTAIDNPKTITIMILSTALFIDIVIAIHTAYHNRRGLIASLIFVTVTPLILVPFTLGFNPYTETESTRTHPYLRNTLARNGLFVTTYNDCYGLRDRFGRIIAPIYKWSHPLDEEGNYIALKRLEASKYTNSTEEVYDIYDLKNRKFIFESYTNTPLKQVIRVNENQFKLINSQRQHFATLYLPGAYDENHYYKEADIVQTKEVPDDSIKIFLPLYDSVIASAKKKRNHTSSPFTIAYFMYDITGDSIPELWLKTGTYEGDYQIEVFGYVNGRLRSLFKNYAGHTDFYIDNGTITSCTSHMGEGKTTTYRYANGKIHVENTPFNTWPSYETDDDGATDTVVEIQSSATEEDSSFPINFIYID